MDSRGVRLADQSLSFGLGLLLLTALPAAVHGELPALTGEFAIGRSVFDWTDTSRLETQSGKAGEHRELLVYLFYPIDKSTAGPRSEYFPYLKKVEAFEERFGKNFF